MSPVSEPEQLPSSEPSITPPLSRKLFPATEESPPNLAEPINKSRMNTMQGKTSPPQAHRPQSKLVRTSSLKQPSTHSSRLRNPRPQLVTEARSVASQSRLKPAQEEVRPPPSCHEGLTLTPTQVADLFTLFDDARREWPSIFRSAAEAPTDVSVGTTAIAGNLSREPDQHPSPYVCTRRFDDPSSESAVDPELMSAVTLQSKIVSLRETSVRLMLEMRELHSELESGRRQRDILKERESKHEEQIQDAGEESGRRPSQDSLVKPRGDTEGA